MLLGSLGGSGTVSSCSIAIQVTQRHKESKTGTLFACTITDKSFLARVPLVEERDLAHTCHMPAQTYHGG